jgi:hypothetical protein
MSTTEIDDRIANMTRGELVRIIRKAALADELAEAMRNTLDAYMASLGDPPRMTATEVVARSALTKHAEASHAP